jgi:hypothetical protein
LASWAQFEKDAPDLAAKVKALFDAKVHKVLGTLRQDGSPRLSGSECVFRDGELEIGSMFGALKAKDLQRDPRFSLQSGTVDPPDWQADARISGRMVEITDDAKVKAANGDDGPSHLFRAEIREVSLVRLGPPPPTGGQPDHLVVESWSEGRGYWSVERR